MATVQELLKASLRSIGAIAVGETPTAAELADGLEALQFLLAEWSGAGLTVPCLTSEAITLVIGQAAYTVGKNGAPDLNTVRPEQIVRAFVRESGFDYPVTIIGERSYLVILDKTVAGRPDRLWYNATSPNGTISVYPAPDAGDALWITSVKPFIKPTVLTEDLINTTEIPANYTAALRWNLALEMCPEYGLPPSPVIVARAKESYNTLVSLNASRRAQPAVIEVAGVVGSDYNIMEG